MKITGVEVLHCDAGWRPWSFVKVSTNESIVGYSECTESFGSISGVEGCVKDLGKVLVGEDPRAVEFLYWKMYRLTRQSPGGVVQKAIGGIENALLDIKAKQLGIPVYEMLGGPTREEMRVYWSHCGTTRVRSPQFLQAPPIKSMDDVAELGREVARKGFTALKTNLILPGKPPMVLMQGYKGEYGSTDLNIYGKTIEGVKEMLGCLREGAGKGMDIMLDMNFNFRKEGYVQLARALEDFGLMWLELDCYDPKVLGQVRDAARMPICSCEDLYGLRAYKPYFERQAMDVCAIDVLWNGVLQSKKIADAAEAYEMNVAPHNHYSHLATMISASFCAMIPNVRILEVEMDDVPWKDELVTNAPEISGGMMKVPRGPGWGADLDEEVLKQHPWPKKREG